MDTNYVVEQLYPEVVEKGYPIEGKEVTQVYIDDCCEHLGNWLYSIYIDTVGDGGEDALIEYVSKMKPYILRLAMDDYNGVKDWDYVIQEVFPDVEENGYTTWVWEDGLCSDMVDPSYWVVQSVRHMEAFLEKTFGEFKGTEDDLIIAIKPTCDALLEMAIQDFHQTGEENDRYTALGSRYDGYLRDDISTESLVRAGILKKR